MIAVGVVVSLLAGLGAVATAVLAVSNIVAVLTVVLALPLVEPGRPSASARPRRARPGR